MANEKKMIRMNELTDDQLDNVVGGAKIGDREQYECSICGAQVLHEYRYPAAGVVGSAGWYCTVCGHKYRKPGVAMVANNTRPGTVSM